MSVWLGAHDPDDVDSWFWLDGSPVDDAGLEWYSQAADRALLASAPSMGAPKWGLADVFYTFNAVPVTPLCEKDV